MLELARDKLIGILTTSSKDGTFSGTWTATPRSDGGAYDFYAVFEGKPDLGKARSQTFSVSVIGHTEPVIDVLRLSSSYITLDPIASDVAVGTKVIFSGTLKLENGNPAGKIVYIKDEDSLDQDDILAQATVGPDGRYQTSWIVRDVDSNDRRLLAAILPLIDPTFASSALLNTFLTTVEKNTVEIFAVFEGDENHLRDDTCIMDPAYAVTAYSSSAPQKNCRNNTLVISDMSSSGEIIGLILYRRWTYRSHTCRQF